LLLTVLAAVGAWWYKHRVGTVEASLNTIAVLPLQNLNGDFAVDYLRFALADEITNVLTYTRQLEVRPSSLTRKFVEADMDPRKVGRELHVGTLLTGHFLRQGDRLLITLEAIDANSDKLLWQSNLNASSKDLTGLQGKLAAEMRQGLVPVLGASGGVVETGTQAKNPEGYDLYLRSIAVPHDPGPNKDAIGMLERAVALDANYAPAWEALGQRYYYDATYSTGGEAMFQKSSAAYERALALDPNRVFAASNLITNQVSRGELAKAYAAAQDLVKRRPDSAEAHFALGYVLRYAGMQEEAAQQCDAAIRLDPGNYHLRSCAFAFMELGRTQRAMDFVRLDLGSEWSNWVAPAILLREGKVAEARERAQQMPAGAAYHRGFLQACLQSQTPGNMDKLTKDDEAAAMADPDPEFWYLEGTIMAFCGQKASALHLLKAAVEQNYCAYSAMLSDPLLEKLRKEQEFDVVLTAAHECQSGVRNP
jgi:TolB-like protein